MKVAILTPTLFDYSGIDRIAKQQAEELTGKGHRVTVLTLASNTKLNKDVDREIIGMPKNAFLQRIYRLIFPLDIIKTAKYITKLKNYDIMISHHYPMNWLAYITKKFYNSKYIYYNHPIMPFFFYGLKEQIYIKLFHFMTKITVKNVDSVISISYFAKNEFKKKTGIDSRVVYNKIDTRRFSNAINNLKIRERYSLRSDPVILFVGQIHPHKGIHLLIEAFNLVKEEIPNAKLLIVGKPAFKDYSKKLNELANSSVIFAGNVLDEELPYYYAAGDVYATASLWEGFDLPIVEAMACGKPVVAFDICPHKEIVKEEMGLLVPQGNCRALAEAIIKILSDEVLAQKIGCAGYELVRKEFAWEKSTEYFLEILKEVLGE